MVQKYYIIVSCALKKYAILNRSKTKFILNEVKENLNI